MPEAAYSEPYRPQYHFSPPANWMNDPNGMVYFEGEYHLFYQYHPGGTTWGPMHWGHAVSTDLIRWEHLPIALEPDQNGSIFSGSAVVDREDSSGFFGGKPGLVAIFTHAAAEPEPGRYLQRQSLAYSADKGRTWTMYEGNPVLGNEEFSDFRDPKVFYHSGTERWIMSIAAGDRILFYTSLNLREWSFASEFGAEEGSHEGVWECPDLIELPVEGADGLSRWVLIVSIAENPEFKEGSRTQYFVGSFDGAVFVNDNAPDTVLWLDHGRDNYAGVTWSDVQRPDGTKLFIGWMSNWKYANVTPTNPWRSAMTLPRILSLKEGASGIRLLQRPVPELQQLRRQSQRWDEVVVSPGHNLLAGVQGGLVEIECELETGAAAEIGFKLRTSSEEETVVRYQAGEQILTVDRTKSGESAFHEAFACSHQVRAQTQDGRLRLHLFVDQSSLEVFVNDGEIAVTDQIFPSPASTGLEFYAVGGAAKVLSLSLHRLHSIHA